jgi:hypothetical protein
MTCGLQVLAIDESLASKIKSVRIDGAGRQ